MNRRHFLLHTAAGVFLAACHGDPEPVLDDDDREALCVEEVLGPLATVPGSLSTLGYEYLFAYPEESDVTVLLNAVFANIDADGDLTASLREVIEAEHDAAEVVSIGGWRLARTEARLAALVYLSEQC